MNIYGLYKGDTFIDVGTANEIAERQGLKPSTIRWLAGSTRQKNKDTSGENCLIAIIIDNETE